VARALLERVFGAGYGWPKRLHSDQGKEFVNECVKELCNLSYTSKTQTTAYHPQGNAYAERIHQFFKNALTAFVRHDQKNWDEIIPFMITNYLTVIHESLDGYSPSQMMFGRNIGTATVPTSFLTCDTKSKAEFSNRLKFALHRLQDDVMQIFRSKREHNLIRSIGKVYHRHSVGDKVGLIVESLPAGFKSLKLFPRFRGPFTVTKVMGDGHVLYLSDPFGQNLPVPISSHRVKSWLERSDMVEMMDSDHVTEDSDEIGRKGLTRKSKRLLGSDRMTQAITSTNDVPELTVPGSHATRVFDTHVPNVTRTQVTHVSTEKIPETLPDKLPDNISITPDNVSTSDNVPDVISKLPDNPKSVNIDTSSTRNPIVRIPWNEGIDRTPVLRSRSTRTSARVKRKVEHEGFHIYVLDIAEGF
jgi:hypothetical protein